MKIMICDDSFNDAKLLYNLTDEYFNGTADITVYDTADRLNGISDGDFDVVIMDIMLDDENLGIDVIKRSSFSETSVIFVSSNPEFFQDVYEVEHIYFTTKPIVKDRFFVALKKAVDVHQKKYVIVAFNGISKRICLSGLIYAEANKHHTILHYDNGTEEDISLSISSLYNELKSCHFVRCHRSYCVNLEFIRDFNSGKITVENDINIPIGRFYSPAVKDEILRFWGKGL